MNIRLLSLPMLTSLLAACEMSDGSGRIDVPLTLLLVFSIIMLVVWFIHQWKKEEEEEKKKKEQEEAALKEVEAKRKKVQEIDDELWGLVRKQYGEPDCAISLDGKDLFNSQLLVFEDKEMLSIKGKFLGFGDLLGYTVEDDKTTIGGNVVETVSSADTGSVLGRAIIGNALGGKAGAIIGGATARRRTRYKYEDEETCHDYTIYINVDDMQEPIIKIWLDEDMDLVHQVSATLDIIIRKKSTKKYCELARQLEKQHQATEKAKQKLQEAEQRLVDIEKDVMKLFGCPDRTILLDDSGDLESKIFVYDRVNILLAKGLVLCEYKKIKSYTVKDGEPKVVCMEIDNADNPIVEMAVSNEARLKEVTDLLDGIISGNAARLSNSLPMPEAPKMEGYEFTSQVNGGKVRAFFDDAHEKAVVEFDTDKGTERHVIDEFCQNQTGTVLGRLWVIDTTRHKAIYANTAGDAPRLMVYDYTADDKNAGSPCQSTFKNPISTGYAISPDGRKDGSAPSNEPPSYFIPAFITVEEGTAYVALFTDKGCMGLNFASSEENKGRDSSYVSIAVIGQYGFVTDDYCKRLVVLSPLHAPIVLGYQDIVSVAYGEETDSLRPNKVNRMFVKLTHAAQGDAPEDFFIELGYKDECIDTTNSDDKESYDTRKQEATQMEQLINAIAGKK